ncbi:helix-turn-helix domain-containing protein [Gammaproteobacteria bacterium]|jgi:AraC-like DNA-binding protein|nr:helix-turn-helix domain-containing protein [Gammaproteobacteria bacterium]
MIEASALHQNSSYGPIAIAIYQTLESYGVDAASVMQKHGVDLGRLKDPTARLDPAVHRRIVAEAVEITEDPGFGLRFSDFVHPTTFHALGFALLSSSTLRAFCQRWVRYHSFITTMGKVSIDESGTDPALVFPSQLPNADSVVGRVLIDGQIATVLKLIRFMYRPDYFPAAVELVCSEIAGTQDLYRKYFGSDVRFSQERNAICFARADLDARLPAANAELARQNDEAVLNFLARLDRANVVAQAHAKLIELLPSGDCSKSKVASALNMSVRTLHNRLADSGTTYQQLLDRTRRKLAEQYMQQQNISVSEVAYLLGFSDCSNFSRAFHRWTGQSPSDFRDKSKAEIYAVK